MTECRDDRYVHRFTIDIQMEIQDLARDQLISNLESIGLQYSSNSANLNEFQPTAIAEAVRQALQNSLAANGLP